MLTKIVKKQRKIFKGVLATAISILAVLVFAALSFLPRNLQAETALEKWRVYSGNLQTDTGLVAYYDFEEGKGLKLINKASGSNREDYIPEKSDGTLYGGTAWTQGRWPGKGALKFDGTDDYVNMDRGSGAGSDLDITDTNLTVECWFKVSDPKATWKGICGNYQSGTGGYAFFYTGDEVSFYFGKVATGAVSSSGSKAGDGQWHQAIGVLDKGMMNIYVDGVKQTSEQTGQTILTSTYPFVIGRYGFAGATYFNGVIDEIAIYKRALSAVEIKKHYEAGKP